MAITARNLHRLPAAAELSMLTSVAERNVGAQSLTATNASDTVDQTVPAGGTVRSAFASNAIGPSLPTMAVDQAAWFDFIGASIIARDASGMLQVRFEGFTFFQGIGGFFQQLPIIGPTTAITLEKVLLAGVRGAAVWPIPLFFGDGSASTDVISVFNITNLDGAAAHVFRRSVNLRFRILHPVQASEGLLVG